MSDSGLGLHETQAIAHAEFEERQLLMTANTKGRDVQKDTDDAPAQPDQIDASSVFDWQTGTITPGPEVMGATPFEIAKYRAARRNREAALHLKADVTRPGGAFLENGIYVDANGVPIDAPAEEIEADIQAAKDAAPSRAHW
jgi:hypothetical protein